MSEPVTRRVPCPGCGARQSAVKDSRTTPEDWQRRRRLCDACGHRWTTMEIPFESVALIPLIIKRLREMRDELTLLLAQADAIKIPGMDEQ